MTALKLRNYIPAATFAAMLNAAANQTADELNGSGWLALSENERRLLKKRI